MAAPTPVAGPTVLATPGPGATSAYLRALFTGAADPFPIPARTFVSIWTLETPANPPAAPTGPTDFLHACDLRQLPSMPDLLGRFSLAEVRTVRVHIPPQYVDVDVTIGLVPHGTVLAKDAAGARKLFASHGQQQIYWRKALTVAQVPYVDLIIPAEWPVSTSLKSVGEGLFPLGLAVGFRPLAGTTLPPQPVHLRIEMEVAVAGLGIWGHQLIA